MDCCNPAPVMVPWIPSFLAFSPLSNTVPQLYWNVESNEQRYKLLCEQLHKLVCYSNNLAEHVNIDHASIEELQELFAQFQESGFDEYYLAQIEQWVNDNLETLYHLLVKQVYFGINEQGRFVAYIPESWDDIIFDTGFVYGQDTYGRLILRWDVDNSGESVNQRPEDWS